MCWKRVHSSVVDGSGHVKHLQLCTNRKFGMLHYPPPKAAEFLEKEELFHVFECTAFPFFKCYHAAKTPLEFDWSGFLGLGLLSYT